MNTEVHNYNCQLSPEFIKRAKSELHEDPDTRKIELQTLRERLQRYPGLKSRVDDAFLLRFMRARKFDQEKVFQLVLNYYQMKKNHEDLFAEMTPQFLRGMLEEGIINVLPDLGNEGETIIVLRAGKWNTEKYRLIDLFKLIFLVMSVVIKSEETQIAGVRFIEDLEGVTWVHAKQMNPSDAKLMASMLQDAFPMRLKAVHYIHEPTFFDYLYAMVKPFLKEKILKRIHFHGDKFVSLHEHIDPEVLPQEYKGKKPPMDSKDLMEKVRMWESEFADDAKFGFVSMTVKDSSKKSADAMENLPGTFKKLNVD